MKYVWRFAGQRSTVRQWSPASGGAPAGAQLQLRVEACCMHPHMGPLKAEDLSCPNIPCSVALLFAYLARNMLSRLKPHSSCPENSSKQGHAALTPHTAPSPSGEGRI